MKERSGMPYDVVAFSTDEDAYLWTNQEEGAFHRLMRHAWINGGIPDDIKKIAGICREPLKVMHGLWPALEGKWPIDPMQPDRRVNPKQESEREFKEEKSGKAKESAAKRWEKERAAKAHAKAAQPSTADALRTHSEGNAPLPSPPRLSASSSKKLKETNTAPSALGVDVFEAIWEQYPCKDGKRAALAHFKATVKTADDLERCMSALESYKTHLALHPEKPMKNGSTWFHNWQDWYEWVEPEARNGNGKVPPLAKPDMGAHFIGDTWQPVTHVAACDHEYECTDKSCMEPVNVGRYCPPCIAPIGASP